MFGKARVAVVGLLAAAAVTLGASTASATTFGCTIPTIAGDIFWDLAYYEGDFSSTEKVCRNQCQVLFSGCLKVVAGAYKCVRGGEDAYIDADKRNCYDLEDESERKECSKDHDSSKRSFNSDIRDDIAEARGECRDEANSCKSSCSESPE